MNIKELFGNGKTVFSLEIFPPKRTSSIDSIYSTLDEISEVKPDYISVTYGASGSSADNKTRDIAALIKSKYGIESMAHLVCVRTGKDELDSILDDFAEHGVDNILALRGDPVPDYEPKRDFLHASDLTAAIKAHGGFGIAGACYPEGHVEAETTAADVLNLRRKVDAGAETLVSQLFFDNSYFHAFREKATIAGINVPIEAGIMPVSNKNQIERMVAMCGASLPQKFVKMLQRYENNPEALLDAGIAYAVDQIVDLISNGVDGIHLYAMNKPYIVKKIYESVKTLL